MSETHYSLKEMETPFDHLQFDLKNIEVGNPLLSERDGNYPVVSTSMLLPTLRRKPTTL